MKTKTYQIANMECPNCAMILESIEDKLPGIHSIRASYKKGEMTVEYDETQVSESDILTAIERKGYTVHSTNEDK
ncbi:MAG: cation transporter [Anaerolineales bacterium]|nr:cation transporter [Anaerolineales bacterium]MCX7756554.1 cation transporter [Anaerolineales bacterium]MDW8279380.1 cation transporter [Anaerolineales bacterium]